MEGETAVQESAPVLVIDDDPAVLELVRRTLERNGIPCDCESDAQRSLRLLRNGRYSVVLTDIRMPGVSGIEIFRRVKPYCPDLYFVAITGVADTEVAIEALKMGFFDYLLKPLNLDEVVLSVQRAMEKRRLELELRAYQEELEAKVVKRTEELIERSRQLRRLLLNTIQTLVFTLEAKDKFTEGHSRRVSEIAAFLAERLGLPRTEVQRVELAGLLHDIGKIGVHEQILSLPRRLTAEEFDHVKIHPGLGARILEPVNELQDLIPAVLHHHERYDGSGYPYGLQGEAIPLYARIVAVADAYEAMRSERPYRQALDAPVALQELKDGRAQSFDPRIVAVLERWQGEIDERMRGARSYSGQSC
ncbi:MAG: HD domain-containing protein [candidate division KSB1 bacterium]|nr:HD domain-containing protein [candidate division KSB1 bacterium]